MTHQAVSLHPARSAFYSRGPAPLRAPQQETPGGGSLVSGSSPAGHDPVDIFSMEHLDKKAAVALSPAKSRHEGAVRFMSPVIRVISSLAAASLIVCAPVSMAAAQELLPAPELMAPEAPALVKKAAGAGEKPAAPVTCTSTREREEFQAPRGHSRESLSDCFSQRAHRPGKNPGTTECASPPPVMPAGGAGNEPSGAVKGKEPLTHNGMVIPAGTAVQLPGTSSALTPAAGTAAPGQTIDMNKGFDRREPGRIFNFRHRPVNGSLFRGNTWADSGTLVSADQAAAMNPQQREALARSAGVRPEEIIIGNSSRALQPLPANPYLERATASPNRIVTFGGRSMTASTAVKMYDLKELVKGRWPNRQFIVTSSMDGRHQDPNHYTGKAVDFVVVPLSTRESYELEALCRQAGLRPNNEYAHGSLYWTGPHMHVDN